MVQRGMEKAAENWSTGVDFQLHTIFWALGSARGSGRRGIPGESLALCQLTTTLWGPLCYPPLTSQETRLTVVISPRSHPRPLGDQFPHLWNGSNGLGLRSPLALTSGVTLREITEVASPNLITKPWRAGWRYPSKRTHISRPRWLLGWWGQ